jgi:release factor glutamine methyltransferase
MRLAHPITDLAEEGWTIRQALVRAAAYLQSENLPDPCLSAELLLGSVLGLDRLGLLMAYDQPMHEIERRLFEEKVVQRSKHHPIAYLTGHKEFWSLDFEVNSGVLIPRPETELLVEETIGILSDRREGSTVVELGTGSGAVIIALTKSIDPQKKTRFLATDRSRWALETARKNAIHHQVEDRISFVQGDWLVSFSDKERWIDVLVSNPPYIAETDIPHLPATVKDFEPPEALYGGADGLEAIGLIFQQATEQLKPGGWLVLEIGEAQAAQVLKLTQTLLFDQTTIRRDYAGKDRILKACYHG